MEGEVRAMIGWNIASCRRHIWEKWCILQIFCPFGVVGCEKRAGETDPAFGLRAALCFNRTRTQPSGHA
jgi:hypothetical protein